MRGYNSGALAMPLLSNSVKLYIETDREILFHHIRD